MVSRSFLVQIFGSFRYKVMSFAKRDHFTTSFPNCLHFISSFCLISLGRNSNTLLKKSGYTCLIPDLEDMLSAFTHQYDVHYRFLMYSLYYVKTHSFYSQFHQSFYCQRMLNFIEDFFFIYWDDPSDFCLCFY
jgi:hypothetical protein